MYLRNVLMLALTVLLSATPAFSQGADSGSSGTDATAAPPPPANLPAGLPEGGTVTTAANGQPLLPEGNPLTGLFTPQPQYVTPQSQMNSVQVAPGDKNPIGKVFSSQGPITQEAPTGTNNMLQGAFTGQPQFATPQSQVNPEPQAKFAIPGYGQADFADMAKAGVPFSVPGTDIGSPGRPPAPGAPGADAQPSAVDKNGAAGANEKTSSKDKDGKDATKASGKDGDKAGDKTTAKDKDAAAAKDKDGDAAKDKAADGEDKDKKEAADKEKKEAADKEAAKEAEKLKQLGPYNPVKDAIFFLNAGQYKEALGIISTVLAKTPTNADAHYIAAVCFVGLRDFNMAADEYRLVLRLVPTTPLAQMSIDGLKKIRMPVTMSSVLPGKLPPLRGH